MQEKEVTLRKYTFTSCDHSYYYVLLHSQLPLQLLSFHDLVISVGLCILFLGIPGMSWLDFAHV